MAAISSHFVRQSKSKLRDPTLRVLRASVVNLSRDLDAVYSVYSKSLFDEDAVQDHTRIVIDGVGMACHVVGAQVAIIEFDARIYTFERVPRLNDPSCASVRRELDEIAKLWRLAIPIVQNDSLSSEPGNFLENASILNPHSVTRASVAAIYR